MKLKSKNYLKTKRSHLSNKKSRKKSRKNLKVTVKMRKRKISWSFSKIKLEKGFKWRKHQKAKDQKKSISHIKQREERKKCLNKICIEISFLTFCTKYLPSLQKNISQWGTWKRLIIIYKRKKKSISRGSTSIKGFLRRILTTTLTNIHFFYSKPFKNLNAMNIPWKNNRSSWKPVECSPIIFSIKNLIWRRWLLFGLWRVIQS